MNKNIIFLKGVKLKTLLGVKKSERKNKQYICVSCIIKLSSFQEIKENINRTLNYKLFLKNVKMFINISSFYLLETLTFELAQFLLNKFKLEYVLVKVEKLEVLKDIKKIGVVVERYK